MREMNIFTYEHKKRYKCTRRQENQSATSKCHGMFFHISESRVASLQYKVKRDHTQYVFFARKMLL